jgi:hypothetical protein
MGTNAAGIFYMLMRSILLLSVGYFFTYQRKGRNVFNWALIAVGQKNAIVYPGRLLYRGLWWHFI